MSKISTYSLADQPLQLSDRLIGTEAPRPTPSSTPLATKNFSLQELMQLFAANFPAPTLQAVLNAGNVATQNITLTGTITATLIKPTNIEDVTGSQGTTFQVLSKAVSGINWVNLPNTAIWGNITGTITNQTDLINYISSNYYPLSSNPAGYITGITSVDVVNALGFSPYDSSNPAGYITSAYAASTYYPLSNPANYVTASYVSANYFPIPTGTTLQYIRGDGSLATFPSVSAGNLEQVLTTGNESTTQDAIFRLDANKYLKINRADQSIELGDGVNDVYYRINEISRNSISYPLPTGATSQIATLLDIPSLTGYATELWVGNNFYPLSSNPAGYLTQDNVVEYANLASFPIPGVIGTIYIALDTGLFYTWNGTTYVLSSPPDTGITGVGTTNTYPKFTSPTTIGNGRLVDGANGGIYTLGSQWINLINGGSVLTLNRTQSSINFVLGVQNSFATTIYSSQPQEGLVFDSQGDFAIGSGGPSGSPTQRFYINRTTGNVHIGGAANTAASDKLQVTGDLRVTGAIKDSSNSAGTSGKLLSSTGTGTAWIDPPSSGGIPHATASGTDTYTATITGVTSYADGDAYLVRFTNGNTTSCTLNINTLGAIPLYRNNDGALIGGDIWAGAEMLCVYNSGLNIFQCIGTSPNSLYSYVTNADSVTLTKGMPVYAFGGQGDRMTVKRANNTTDATSAQTVGLVLSTSIAANQKGIIIIQGLLDGLSTLPTSTFADGDPVYLGATAGTITNVKPYAPNHLVYLGVVTTASNGSAGRMYVRVQNGYELDELHNVQAQSPSLKDTLWYDNTVSPAQWKTASISTILGYTPQAQLSGTGFVKISGTTISYDNSTYYLASNPSGFTSNLGTVTSVSALTLGTSGTDLSSSVANGTTTPVITLNVPTASATNRGALSSSDWSKFNNATLGSFGASFDGMGSVVLVNTRTYFRMQKAGTITEWSIIAEGTSPTATFDVWKIASGTALPTVANTIFGTKPALATGNAITSTTMTGWTTSFAANDMFCVNVDACANATKLQLLFKVTYS